MSEPDRFGSDIDLLGLLLIGYHVKRFFRQGHLKRASGCLRCTDAFRFAVTIADNIRDFAVTSLRLKMDCCPGRLKQSNVRLPSLIIYEGIRRPIIGKLSKTR